MAKKRDHVEMERRRRQAGRLFEKNWPVAEVARHLGIARQVGYRWYDLWQTRGVAGLASRGPAGPKCRLASTETETIANALLQGPAAYGYKTQLWTLPRVAGLIEHLTGVRYHPGHVWRVLGSLGFSCQRPERRAIERDEQAIRRWKRTEWPNIKKKRPGKAG